jgi:hypothetical protein
MVDDHHVDTELFRLLQRLDAGRAAINTDQEGGAALRQRPHRFHVRAIAFKQAVGNMNKRVEAALPQIACQHRRRCCAVDVVIAENRDTLAAGHGIGDPLRRRLHGGEHQRIGHQMLDGRIEKCVHRIGFDVAAGKNARQQLGQIVALGNGQRARGTALVEPVAPSAPGRRVFDAKEKTILAHRSVIPGRATWGELGIQSSPSKQPILEQWFWISVRRFAAVQITVTDRAIRASEPMYGGLLKTAIDKEPPQSRLKPAPPYDGTLDTSDLWPFESVNAFFSRFNLMHALLARNLAWHLHRCGYIQTEKTLAVCTPYAAQAKLINKLLDGENLGSLVQVGTVHSFQGDEREAIVLELPEGHGGARMLGQFLQGVPPKQIGARLINVAVSRAKHHLIILANLTYLDRLLPSSSLLRGILYDMQENGHVVPGAELLKLRPIESDLRGLLDRIPLDIDAKTMAIFDQTTFDPAIESDLTNAKQTIVIFSGFVTPSRVARLGDLLRMKAAEGVKIRCVTRPPKLNGTMDPTRSKDALDALERIDCVVDCRARIHEKVVLIDNEIVWHGSLNVLSHTHRTDESMTRVANAGLAKALAFNMSKRRISSETALRTVGDAENPRCEACGARSV